MKNKKIIFVGITVLLVIVVVILSFFMGDTSKESGKGIINKKATVKSIKFDDKKINIYFFWGDGCPHCEEEYEFWDSIIGDYKDKINHIYGMEVWNSKKNAKSMKEFAKFKDEDIKGVPYTIIGDKSFVGYDKSDKNQMKKQIDKMYKDGNKYDIYREMTKNNE